eukprot:5754560-Alexandrium_andersonii.AAC.1
MRVAHPCVSAHPGERRPAYYDPCIVVLGTAVDHPRPLQRLIFMRVAHPCVSVHPGKRRPAYNDPCIVVLGTA